MKYIQALNAYTYAEKLIYEHFTKEESWPVLTYRQNRKMQTNSFVTCFPVSSFMMLLKLLRIRTLQTSSLLLFYIALLRRIPELWDKQQNTEK